MTALFSSSNNKPTGQHNWFDWFPFVISTSNNSTLSIPGLRIHLYCYAVVKLKFSKFLKLSVGITFCDVW